MPGILISFRDFLRSGNFGPLTPDLCLLDVAEKFGAPTKFMTRFAENIPLYWLYGKFEIEFETEAPHKIVFYQIEWASYLEGQYELIKDDIVLLLEGLHGDTKPSAFLQSDLWEAEHARVNVGALSDDIRLNICAGPVTIVFRVDSRFVEDGDAERYVASTDYREIVKAIDNRTEIDSIAVVPRPSDALAYSKFGHVHHLSGRNYLDCLQDIRQDAVEE